MKLLSSYNSEIQYVKERKLLIVIIVFVFTMLMILSLVIGLILPLKQSYPVFVEFKNQENNFVLVKTDRTSIGYALVESQLRKYIRDREIVDELDETNRFVSVRALHEKPSNVENQFIENVNSPKYLIFKNNFKRYVEIIRISKLSNRVVEFHVNFKDYQITQNKLFQSKEFLILVRFKFKNQLIAQKDNFLNPLNIFIQEYETRDL